MQETIKRAKFAFEEFLAWIRREPIHHRVCRKCRKPIKKHHRWRYVQTGWFAPTRCYEHKDCKNPTLDIHRDIVQDFGPGLPFENESMETLP